jgi:hypothetical protein
VVFGARPAVVGGDARVRGREEGVDRLGGDVWPTHIAACAAHSCAPSISDAQRAVKLGRDTSAAGRSDRRRGCRRLELTGHRQALSRGREPAVVWRRQPPRQRLRLRVRLVHQLLAQVLRHKRGRQRRRRRRLSGNRWCAGRADWVRRLRGRPRKQGREAGCDRERESGC